MSTQEVDVFICGAGPVGLVLALHLRQLGISVFIVDAADKAAPNFPMYGRACAFWPRSCELLDQFDLFDEFAQEGLASSEMFHYKDGQRAEHANVIKDATNSYFNIFLFLRLKYIEDILRRKLANLDVSIRAPSKLVDFVLDDSTQDEHKVDVTCVDETGAKFQVKCKYIVGADGGRSTVRGVAGIPFEGERKAEVDHWVRMDGVIKTNFPEARLGICSLESKSHGHVLLAPLDRGTTRIGYHLTPELYEKYGVHMTAEEAAFEAANALAPFELEFTRIDWYTVYGVHQNVAARYQEKERILLAGDAAHTHSSGSAQGMNTGLHDVASLSWRLAGVLNGSYKPEVLANYSEERTGVARQVIENDKILSKLVSGQKPEALKHRPEHPFELLNEIKNETGGFTTGLGISYGSSLLNLVSVSPPKLAIKPGQRLYDVMVRKPGILVTKNRLFELVKNNGKFKVIVLTGQPQHTKAKLATLRSQIDRDAVKFEHALEFVTIVPDHAYALDEYLGVETFGRGFWDPDHEAHRSYGVAIDEGAILVMRPDGILGYDTRLADFESVDRYFNDIVYAKEPKKVAEAVTPRNVGEFVIHNENNLMTSSRPLINGH